MDNDPVVEHTTRSYNFHAEKMSETGPTSEIARRICEDIFGNFFWKFHPKSDDNFDCCDTAHRTPKDRQKLTHPADVVFYYDDPYLGIRIYLHTDMKSYKVDSISSTTLRSALKSLCLTVECARKSEHWRRLYSVPPDEQHDVQGFLFVHNHDHGYEGKFDEALSKVSIRALPVAVNTTLHFMGPADINRLYSISNDLMRLRSKKLLPEFDYTFYYPDLLLKRRNSDDWGQAATIETLMSPFIMIKHDSAEKIATGFLIYYNRDGSSIAEFEYFFDCMSRYQMLEHGQTLRIRSCFKRPHANMLSNFEAAKKKYAKAWGFDKARTKLLENATLETITSVTDTYTPGSIGWRVDED